jgi:hypothetical protein
LKPTNKSRKTHTATKPQRTFRFILVSATVAQVRSCARGGDIGASGFPTKGTRRDKDSASHVCSVRREIFGLPAKFHLDDGGKGEDLPGSSPTKSQYG